MYKIIGARWLRVYTMSDEAVNTFKRRMDENLSVKISSEGEIKIIDGTGQHNNIKLRIEGIELSDKISRKDYLEKYLKMAPQRIDDLITGVIKRVEPEISQAKVDKFKNDYLNETMSIGNPFYLIRDGSGKSTMVVADKALSILYSILSEKSGENPSNSELPDGPEFLLWLFYKYWNELNINRISISNVSSVSNIEEHNHHTYTHRANGEKERDSVEVCFKILLNKALTSLKLQLAVDGTPGNDIEIQLPDYTRSPKSFRLYIPSNSPNVDSLLKEFSSLEDDEQVMLRKGLEAYIFNAILLPPIISTYIREEKVWREEKKDFITEMRKYANKNIEEL